MSAAVTVRPYALGEATSLVGFDKGVPVFDGQAQVFRPLPAAIRISHGSRSWRFTLAADIEPTVTFEGHADPEPGPYTCGVCDDPTPMLYHQRGLAPACRGCYLAAHTPRLDGEVLVRGESLSSLQRFLRGDSRKGAVAVAHPSILAHSPIPEDRFLEAQNARRLLAHHGVTLVVDASLPPNTIELRARS